MNVQVLHGLSSIGAGVDDGAIAVVKALLCRDLRRSGEQLAEECGGFAAELTGVEQTRDVFAGDDQNMHGRLRIDIRKRNHILILVDQFGRDGSVDDFAKQAAHMRSFYAMPTPGVRDETSHKL